MVKNHLQLSFDVSTSATAYYKDTFELPTILLLGYTR